MIDRVPETRVSGFGSAEVKWVFKRQVEQGFSSFFGIFDDFSKWSVPKALLNNNQVCQKFGKN